MRQRSDFRFLDRLRVRWAEVDMQHIVFNGHYLMYFDTAMGGYWRAMGLPYQQTMLHLGGDLYVRKASLEYHASARYDDWLEVGIRSGRIGNSSIVLEGGVFRGEELLVTGELVYVFADPSTQTSKRVPQELRDLLVDFDAGQPMIEVRLGAWDELGREARPIRQTVFIDECRIPADLAWDAADAVAVHAVAYNRLGMPLATGRLLEHGPGMAQVGRMAVIAPMRGSGVGRAVLDALVRAARARGDGEVLLHAQATAVPFFQRAGFAARGQAFEAAGVRHQAMVLGLHAP